MRYREIFRMLASVPVGIALGLTFLVGACGEEEKRAREAAEWLTTYSSSNPPNREWLALNIVSDKDGRVIMDVLVPDKGQVSLIKSRPRIEQAHIVRMACPPPQAEVWKILPPRQELWINLKEKTQAGQVKAITGASCARE